jgi:hypothetical protein
MPAFRQRPLSWLFLIATACLDVLAVGTNHEAPWVDGVVLGQIIVVSAWLVLGRSHRLARAAVFVAAIALVASPEILRGHVRGAAFQAFVRSFVLGSTIAIALVTSALVAFWHGVARVAFGADPVRAARRWQFPMVEIFGWMTIVALAAVGVRQSDFAHLAHGTWELAFVIGWLLAISAAVVVSIGRFRKANWPGGIVESAWLIVFAATVLVIPPDPPHSALGACTYVGLWVLTQKLDDAQSTEAPQIIGAA